jgi:uncharacterized protein (TIGR02647 family)
MDIPDDLFEEIELLNMYRLDNVSEGLKVHHDASPARIDAIKRLHEKDLTTLADGGYLTPLGIQAAEHAQALITILKSN